eukprot:scaffold42416_cov41-Phaeocystis_antarctica.AAC.1
MAWRRVGAGPLWTVIGERLFCRTQGASGAKGGGRSERHQLAGALRMLGTRALVIGSTRDEGLQGRPFAQCTAQRRRRECRRQQLGGRQQSGHLSGWAAKLALL